MHNTYMDTIQIKQIVMNPDYNPALPKDPNNREFHWDYQPVNRPLQEGDVVEFLCNGRGRGNHLRVRVRVTKVNRKTFKGDELPGSYSPGTKWVVNIAYSLEPGNGGLTICKDWKAPK